MSAQTTETQEELEARELFERASKLSARMRESLGLALIETVNPPPGRPDSDWAYWKAEIARRIAAVESGQTKTYTLEETMAHVRKALDDNPK
jgi:putative addiction module component (TIGR02574 family)